MTHTPRVGPTVLDRVLDRAVARIDYDAWCVGHVDDRVKDRVDRVWVRVDDREREAVMR
jgi:hypothetical protein